MSETGDVGTSGTSAQDRDAEEYVNSVMSSQPAAAILRTPLPSTRKRSLSASNLTSLSASEVKKHKGDADADGHTYRERQLAKAKRSLMQPSEEADVIVVDQTQSDTEPDQSGDKHKGKGPSKPKKGSGSGGKKSGKNQKNTANDQPSTSAQNDTDGDVKSLLKKLSEDMQLMHTMLNRKIDLIEDKIEQSEKKITDKVTDKVTKIIDKRVNAESAKLRKEIDSRLSALRDDFNGELNTLSERLDQGVRNTHTSDEDIQLRVVVCNLPESVRENVPDKVNAVIKDGLKIRDVTVVSAERKESRIQSKPGIVIAKFRSREDKTTVMASKKKLRDSRQYRDLYINHDQTREERTLASNMRTLVNGVKRGQNIHVRGNRIVTSPGRNEHGYRSETGRNYETRDRDASSGRAYVNDSRNRQYGRENTRNDTRPAPRDRVNQRRNPDNYSPRRERSAPEYSHTDRRTARGRY